jgi:hypothetical protein
MTTKLNEIFTVLVESLEDLMNKIDKESSSYQFEASFNDLLRNFGQSVFQSVVGNIPKSKNDRVTLLTSVGQFVFTQTITLQLPPVGLRSVLTCRNNCVVLAKD